MLRHGPPRPHRRRPRRRARPRPGIRIQPDLAASGAVAIDIRAERPVADAGAVAPQHAERRRRGLVEGRVGAGLAGARALAAVAAGEGGAGEGGGERRGGDAAEAVVRGPARGFGPEAGGRVGEDVVRVGDDFDVLGFHDAVAVERGDPFEVGGVVGREGRGARVVACGRVAAVVGRVRAGAAGVGARAASRVHVAAEVAERFGAVFRFGEGGRVFVDGELGGVVDGGVGEGHELIEDGEFKLQLYAVDHRFQGGFDLVVAFVFHGEQ